MRFSSADAVIFDLDGVLTETTRLHRQAWSRLFNEYLHSREAEATKPFTDDDYRRYVDGKPRYDGVESFLRSRGIDLPRGNPGDPPGSETICALGNRKNEYFIELLESEGVRRYDTSIALVEQLRRDGVSLAVVTSSRNGRRILHEAGLSELFDVRLDGVDASELRLPGKPDPAIFLEAARRLGVEPARAVVVEDAVAGVEAGRRGGFGLVIGIARDSPPEPLLDAGADRVVTDLADLAEESGQRIRDLPPLPKTPDGLAPLLGDDTPSLFIDYDGTLTPIVKDPSAAELPQATRAALEKLRPLCTVAVISGRDLADLQRFVGLRGIFYAGSHGMHMCEPDGTEHERGREFLPALAGAERRLRDAVAGIAGAHIERKRFAIAVHYRDVTNERTDDVLRAVERVRADAGGLVVRDGKKVRELRPDTDWDKGAAVRWILEVTDTGTRTGTAVYVGDDVTDEDAFRALPAPALAIVVRGEDDDRSTSAAWALADTGEVRQFLESVTRILETREEQ